MENKLILKKLLAVMADLPPIPKDKKGYQYMFRSVEDAYEACNPLMIKHSILMRPELHCNDIIPFIRWIFVAVEDGSEFPADIPLTVVGNKYQDGGIAISYTQKTAVWCTFMVKTGDIKNYDPDSKQPDPKKAAPPKSEKINVWDELGKHFPPDFTDTEKRKLAESIKAWQEEQDKTLPELLKKYGAAKIVGFGMDKGVS